MDWFRWYHGTTSDPKWKVIAKASGVSVPVVIAIWATLMESASANEDDRGTLSGWNPEDIAALFDVTDVTDVTVTAVTRAMQGRVLRENKLISWEKRNPKRERQDDSAERVRRFREKQKQDETPRNAKKRLDKRRVEKKRLEEKGKGTGETAARKTSAPAELPVTDAMRRWAGENQIAADLESETQAMLDFHRGAGNLKLDWIATWRTWMRNTKKWGGRNGTRQPNQTQTSAGGRASRPYTPKQ